MRSTQTKELDKDRKKAQLLLKSMRFINSGILASVVVKLVMILTGFESKDYAVLTSIISVLIGVGLTNLIVLLYYTGKVANKTKNGK